MAQWMFYATVVALLLAAALRLLEATFVHTGRARWFWMAGLLGALGLPLARPYLAPFVAGWWTVPAESSDLVTVGVPRVVAGLLPTPDGLALLGQWVLAAWAGATLALLGITLAGLLRLRTARRGWVEQEMDGATVLVSRDVGPAVVGLVRPTIVVPAWVADLEDGPRRLILAHESEHLRGRDPVVLAAGLAAAVLMPWNAGVWWVFSRLRQAVETDCDHRVLRHEPGSVHRYASLLLQVGTRTARPVPLGAGFGECTSSLERRIRTMVKGKEVGWRGVALRAVVAGVLVAAACSVDDPENGLPTAVDPAAVTQSAVEEAVDISQSPMFTPFTVAPTILNREQVVAAMERSYPPLLRDAGIGGSVRVYFFINDRGDVERTLLDKSSGHEALDQAAMAVADVYQFSPALNRDQRVPVWVSFPITFQVQ